MFRRWCDGTDSEGSKDMLLKTCSPICDRCLVSEADGPRVSPEGIVTARHVRLRGLYCFGDHLIGHGVHSFVIFDTYVCLDFADFC